jgi:hypothetical protein
MILEKYFMKDSKNLCYKMQGVILLLHAIKTYVDESEKL